VSQRERWIIYPLLFFSFALAIRDQWPVAGKSEQFNVLNCRHLVVRDSAGQPAVDIHAKHGRNAGSGVITVYGPSPPVGTAKAAAVRLYVAGESASEAGNYGVVETYGPLGARATQLVGDNSGGTLHLFDPRGKPRPVLRLIRSAQPDEGPQEDDPRKAKPRPPVPTDSGEDLRSTEGTPSAKESAAR